MMAFHGNTNTASHANANGNTTSGVGKISFSLGLKSSNNGPSSTSATPRGFIISRAPHSTTLQMRRPVFVAPPIREPKHDATPTPTSTPTTTTLQEQRPAERIKVKDGNEIIPASKTNTTIRDVNFNDNAQAVSGRKRSRWDAHEATTVGGGAKKENSVSIKPPYVPNNNAAPKSQLSTNMSKSIDSLAAMEEFMKKAEQTELAKLNETTSADVFEHKNQRRNEQRKKHHIGSHIPEAELAEFEKNCRSANGQEDPQSSSNGCEVKISSDNKGHQLLRKMGWSTEKTIGGGHRETSPSSSSSSSSVRRIVTAEEMMKKAQHGGSTLGVGSGTATHQVTEQDDIYEQYKKRMMLGYKHRPNPLNNPRKQYY